MEEPFSFSSESLAKPDDFTPLRPRVAARLLSHFELFPERAVPVLEPVAQALKELLVGEHSSVELRILRQWYTSQSADERSSSRREYVWLLQSLSSGCAVHLIACHCFSFNHFACCSLACCGLVRRYRTTSFFHLTHAKLDVCSVVLRMLPRATRKKIERFNARLVACRNEQVSVVAHGLTFAAELKLSTVKIILVLSLRWGGGVPARHRDIPNAYVKAN
uniref:Uncharacterized protein n=1 Tax=Peronospora matthiolae TaxID=2874970 RepID=A0AAV1VLA9_9STRA